MTYPPLEFPREKRGAVLRALSVLAIAGAGASATGVAHAVDCNTLPTPIYGIGGSAATNLIKRLGTRLAAAPEGEKITVIYSDPGACAAMTALVQNKPLEGSGKYWDANGTEATCTYPAGSTLLADWGAMAQEATTCQGVEALPASIGDYLGPISGFSLIVPNASTEFSISAEAIYLLYGFGIGAGYDVAPWTVPAAVASRTTTSAAGLLLAKAVGIPQARALAFSQTNDVKSNQGAVDWITAQPAAVANPNAAIGFCSTETADANRAKVRTLAFKAIGQDCAYGPDSTVTATDKKNVREGRYYLWNAHHVFARLNEQKQPVTPQLTKFVDIFTSKAPLPGSQSYIDLLIANGNVPECAMHVKRAGDMGPLASFQHDKPCGCYFDSKTTGTTPSCKACTTDSECGSGSVCSYNFCEVK